MLAHVEDVLGFDELLCLGLQHQRFQGAQILRGRGFPSGFPMLWVFNTSATATHRVNQGAMGAICGVNKDPVGKVGGFDESEQ